MIVEPEVEPDPAVDEATFQALNAIGVQAENFDPNADPPPFYDAETGTAYWIGVFQPDKDDRENCVTSILSLGRNPETGEMLKQGRIPGAIDRYYSSPVAGDGKIYMTSEKGKIAVLNPDGNLDPIAVNDIGSAER